MYTRQGGSGVTREGLLGYFLDAARPRERWQIGMEVEKLGRDRTTGLPIPYDGALASVRSVLERYHDLRPADPVMEAEHLVGLDGPWGTLSLEPGGQVEWSSRPVPSLAELSRDLDAHLAALSQVGGALGVDWLREALDPAHSLEAMHWMPKARYGIMREFLGPRGRLAHRMMAQTTSIQCAFDYADALDWRRKFKAAALLAPVATALFANSSRVDGAASGWRSFRQRIWQETDPARCGMPPVVFEPDFGIEAWLDWVLDVPTIFRHRARGLVPAGGVPFRALLERSGCDALRMADWETHASTIFTEVRAYTYIEVRSADLQPDELAFAVPALWTGLLYDERALERALALAAPVDDHARWNDAMRAAARDGLEAQPEGGRPMAVLAAELLGLALAGLGRGAGGDDGTGRRALEALAAHLSLEPREPEAAC